MSVRITGGGIVGDFKETGTGVIDFNSGALDLSASFDAGGNDARLEARRVGNTLYVRTSGYPGAEGSWETLDLSKVDGSEAAINAQFEPVEFLAFLQGVADDVRIVDTENLRGDDTTHYAASVTLERALTNTPTSSEQREVLQKATKVFTGTIPTEAWIDDSGRLRKLTMRLHSNPDAVEDTRPPTTTITIEYYEFGTPVEVSAPADAADAEGRSQDRATQSDLRNALTAQKVYYVDNQAYTDDPKSLKDIEPSLDWGGTLKVFVDDADISDNTVCMEETSKSGKFFSIADVAEGTSAGTYYGNGKCPAPPTPEALEALGTASWDSNESSGSSATPDDSEPPIGSAEGVQFDLRNGLTAEKTLYTDQQVYSAKVSDLKSIESSLDWGGGLTVVVGSMPSMGDQIVCLSEAASDGSVYAIADIAAGPYTGTYYGTENCPSAATVANIAKLGTAPWDESATSSATHGVLGPGESGSLRSSDSGSEVDMCDLGKTLVTGAVDMYRDLAGDDTLGPTMDQLVAFKVLPERPTAIELTYVDGKPNVVCK